MLTRKFNFEDSKNLLKKYNRSIYRCALPMCGDPRCASDPRHVRQECRVISENRVKVRLDGSGGGLPHYIYSVVAALRMMDALEAQVNL